ncbi:periplasmic copper-binding protein [bacterium BMS3Abin01]|nr:periplasmic copper-binding protein [bacterium BMS3Abin01]
MTIGADGSGCASIGTWDTAASTCIMNADYDAGTTNGIVINSNGITIDGNGFTLSGSGGNTTGVNLMIKNNVTIKNLTITGFKYGVYLLSSSNNVVYNNNFAGNTYQAYAIGGAGNLFDQPGSGGNYWDNYDTPAEGCSDSNLDYICDAGYSFTGGIDNQPWNQVNGWQVPPPVDTTPPVISNIQPAGYVTTGSPIVSADYSDPSGIDTASVVVSVDGTPLSGCSATTFSVSCPATGLSDGAHAIGVNVADNAGNVATGSGSFTVDTAVPLVSNVLPAGTIFNDSPIVSADYSDSGSGIDTTSVAVTLNGTPLSGCAISGTNVSCATAGLATGTYTIGGSVMDIAGNSAPISGGFDVVAPDTTPPAVTNLQPSGTINTTSTLLSADYADSGDGIDTSTVAVTLDGSPVSGCSVTASSVSCAVSGLAEGSHSMSISVADLAGNTGTGNGVFSVDTTAPLVVNVQPSGTIGASSATISADYSDLSGIDTASVSVTLDGTPVSGCSVGAASVSCPVSGLSPGTHTIGGVVADNAGNTAPVSGSFSFTDAVAPVVSNLQPTGTVTTDSPTITAGYSDDASGIDTSSVVVTLDGAPLGGCTVTASSVSCPVTGLADGTHNYGVSVNDIAGNNGSAIDIFTVDTTVSLNVPTIYLSTSATGGDCASVGIWDAATQTCTLNANLTFTGTNGIIISSNGITLNGNGHSLTGTGNSNAGIQLMIKNNIIIKNLTISGFHYGVYSLSSSNMTVFNNSFVGNTTQAYLSGGSGNTFNLPTPDGGNYWDDFDTPGEGCVDSNSDGFCDSVYTFPGGQDNFPWTYVGWSSTDTTPPVVSNVLPSGTINSATAMLSADYSDSSGINQSTVNVTLDGNPVSGCTVGANNVSCPVGNLIEGTHTIGGAVSDNAGNSSPISGSFSVVDNTAPVISNLLPSGIIDNAAPTLSAVYSDDISGINAATVTVTLDGIPVSGCAVTATDAACNVYGLADGIHNLTVDVSDNAGNAGSTSGSFTVSTDTTPPVVSNLQPGNYINSTNTTLNASYSDTGTGVDTATVVVTLDGTPVSSCAVGANSVSCAVIGLGEGAHSFSVGVNDMVGNAGSASSSFSVDTVNPTVDSIQPSGAQNVNSATIEVYYSDVGSGIDPSSVVITLDSTPLSGCDILATNASCLVYGLADGNHTIDAAVNDMAGNSGTANQAIIIDTVAPSILSMQPSGLINSDSPILKIDYSDLGTGIDTTAIVVNLDGSPVSGCVVGPNNVSCPVSGMAQGAHSYTVNIADQAGNGKSAAGSFNVDSIAPSVTSVLPTGTINTVDATVKVYYDDGAGSGIDTATVAVTLDGTVVSGCAVTATDAACNVYGLADGAHTIGGSVADTAGNVSPVSGSFTVSVADTTPPTVSNVTPTGTITVSYTTISIDYSDAGSGIDTASVDVTLNGTSLIGCAVNSTNATCDVYGLANGIYTIGGSVSDIAGNPAPISGSFTVNAPVTGGCTTRFVDVNGAAMAVYGDPGFSAAVCQYDTLTPNTDYYIRAESPSADLNGNGTNKNKLSLRDMANNNINFGDGSTTLTFTQQAGGPPYVYTATFRTPGTAGVYGVEVRVSDNNNNELRISGWSMRVGSTTSYVKTFTDASYTTVADSYNAGDTVYIEIYDPALTDSTPDDAQSKVDVSDFANNKVSPAVTTLRVASQTYRMSFVLPAGTGDRALKAQFRDRRRKTLAQPMLLVAVGHGGGSSGDITAPVVGNLMPNGTITAVNTTITADYSDTDSGIDSASVVVYLDSVAVSGCTTTATSVSCPVNGLADGTHNIQVDVQDNAGNLGTGRGSFTVSSAPGCTTRFEDINGAAIAMYSDPGYSAALCQYDSLSPNTTYYLQVEHPSMDLNSQGTGRNELKLVDMAGNSVNFGDGSATLTFSQQAGGPSFVYRTAFQTPNVSDAYTLEARLEDSSGATELRVRGYSMMMVGSGAYLKTFSDPGYSVQTDTFGPSDTVYIEMYSPNLTDSTPDAGQSKVDVADFLNNKVSITFDSVSKPEPRTYRMEFTLPGNAGDKALRIDLKDSGGTRIGRPGLLINIQ